MTIDTTNYVLTPGNMGKNCMANGEHKGIECCCDECDYLMCCIEENKKCSTCTDNFCQSLGK